jgi:hypothetical protein
MPLPWTEAYGSVRIAGGRIRSRVHRAAIGAFSRFHNQPVSPPVEAGFAKRETESEGVVMDFQARLRRAVEEYRRAHGYYPSRIILSRSAAKEMADVMVAQQHDLGILDKLNAGKTPDEKFLDGDVAYFKGIPIFAELDPDTEIIME